MFVTANLKYSSDVPEPDVVVLGKPQILQGSASSNGSVVPVGASTDCRAPCQLALSRALDLLDHLRDVAVRLKRETLAFGDWAPTAPVPAANNSDCKRQRRSQKGLPSPTIARPLEEHFDF